MNSHIELFGGTLEQEKSELPYSKTQKDLQNVKQTWKQNLIAKSSKTILHFVWTIEDSKHQV